VEEDKTEEGLYRCDHCFRNDHYRYYNCRRDCGLTLLDLKKDIQKVKGKKKQVK